MNTSPNGSVKNKIVNPDLVEERNKVTFNKEELEFFFLGQANMDRDREFHADIIKHPEMNSSFKFYDMTKEEKQEEWWKRINFLAGLDRKRYFDESPKEKYGYWAKLHLGLPSVGLHLGMFFTTVSFLGSDEQ